MSRTYYVALLLITACGDGLINYGAVAASGSSTTGTGGAFMGTGGAPVDAGEDVERPKDGGDQCFSCPGGG